MKVECLSDIELERLVAERVMLEERPSLDLLKDKDIFNIIWNNDYEDFLFSAQKNWYAATSGYDNGDVPIWEAAHFATRWDEAIRALTTCNLSNKAFDRLEAKLNKFYDGHFISLFRELSPRKICEILVSVV